LQGERRRRSNLLRFGAREGENQVQTAGTMFGLVGYGIAAAPTNDGSGPEDLSLLSEAEGRRVITQGRVGRRMAFET
jgi:hypothetical protein